MPTRFLAVEAVGRKALREHLADRMFSADIGFGDGRAIFLDLHLQVALVELADDPGGGGGGIERRLKFG